MQSGCVSQDCLRDLDHHSYLIGHHNFLGIFKNGCQDLQAINFHVQLQGAACSIPTHRASVTLMTKDSFLLKACVSVTGTAPFLSCPCVPGYILPDTLSNVAPSLIDICRSRIKLRPCPQPANETSSLISTV